MSQNIALTRVSFSSLQTCLTRVHSKVSRKIVPVANNGQECQTRVPKSVLTRGPNNVLQLSYNTVACSERWENDPPTMPNEKQHLLTLHKRHSGFKTQKSEGKKKVVSQNLYVLSQSSQSLGISDMNPRTSR